MTRFVVPALLALSLLGATSSLAQATRGATTAAIDADVWVPVAASVVDGDIVAMGRIYHPAAVLVSANGTQTISSVLPQWGKDIAANKAKGSRATVEFRFTTRQDDADTAFETGAFKYTVIERSGASAPSYRRMEALLVKHEGRWRLVMERQLEALTETEWQAMGK